MEQGTQKVVDSEFFPAAEKSLRRQAPGHRAGQHRRLRRLRPGPVRDPQGRPVEVRPVPRRRHRRASPRASCAPSRSATSCRRPTIVGGHMFSLYSARRGCTASARSSTGTGSGGCRRRRVETDWDFGARNLRSSRWLHRRIDVDFNRWFMCLIPTEVRARDRAQPAAVHQVGRLGVRRARRRPPATRR